MIYKLLALLATVLLLCNRFSNGQSPGDVIEDINDDNKFNPSIIPSRMYDYTTDTIAYKDKSTKKCYIQRMQKTVPLPLYVSKASSDSKEVEILAGKGIARFCNGLEVYKLLVPLKTVLQKQKSSSA